MSFDSRNSADAVHPALFWFLVLLVVFACLFALFLPPDFLKNLWSTETVVYRWSDEYREDHCEVHAKNGEVFLCESGKYSHEEIDGLRVLHTSPPAPDIHIKSSEEIAID